MSTHIDGLHTDSTTVTKITSDELAEHYNEIEDLGDESVLALEAPGNCHLVVVEGDLVKFARDVWKAAFGKDREEPEERIRFTCKDCDSGEMTQEAAFWHASHEGHVTASIADDAHACDECDEPATKFWPKLTPPVQLCDSCHHHATRSGWEPGA